MFALCALLPFFFIPLAYVTILQSKVLLISILLIAAGISWFAARFATRTARVPKSSVVASALLLPFAYAVSTIVSGINPVSLVGAGVEQDTLVATALAFASLALAACIFSETPKSAIGAMRALSLGALILMIIQIVHLIVPSLPLSAVLVGQTSSLVGSWYELVLVAALFVYLGVALFDTVVGEGRWRYVLLALSLLSLFFLIVVEISDAWIVLALLSLSSLVFHWYVRRPRESWVRCGIWLGLSVISILFVVFGSTVSHVLPTRLQVQSIEIRPSWQATLEIGRQALSKPTTFAFGVGPNTFSREWSLYKPSAVNQTQFWSTDFNSGAGTLPTSLVTAGVIGCGAWLVFMGALFWMFVSCLRAGQRNPLGPLLFGAGCGCLYLIALHILYVPQAGLNTLTFLFVGIYVALAADAGVVRIALMRLSFGERAEYMKAVAGCAAGLIFLAAGLFALRVTLAEILVNRSTFLYQSPQDIGKATTLIQDALFVYKNDARAQRAAVELGIFELQTLIAAPGTTTDAIRAQLQNTLTQTIQHGLAAVSIDNHDYQNWLEVASLYQNLAGANVQGAYDNAYAAYQQALAGDPKDPVVYYRLAQLELLENKPDAALADAQSALRLKPDFAAVYYLASQAYVSKNDLTNAAAAAAQAVRYAPDDTLGWYNAGAIAYAQGNWQGAATYEQQALARDSQYTDALYVLGLAYYQLQMGADSMATFQALLKLNPNDSSVAQILSNLEAGKAPLQAASSTSATATTTSTKFNKK